LKPRTPWAGDSLAQAERATLPRPGPYRLFAAAGLFEDSKMIFTLPLVGKIAAAYAASKASASSTTQNIIQQKLQVGGDDAVSSASFAQTFNNVGQATGVKAPISTAKL
jgi:hypothetical protein